MLASSIGPALEEAPKANAGARLRALFPASGKMRVLRIAAHRTVMVAGVGAIGAISVLFVKPELTDHIKAMSPFAAHHVRQAAAPAAATAPVPIPAPAPAPASAVATVSTVAIVAANQPVPAAQPKVVAAATGPGQNVPAVAEHSNTVEHATKIVVAEQKEPTPREQKWVTNWLAKRYRVAGDAANMLVSATYRTAMEVKIDPLLVLAVMAIESGFNPFAESPVGAQGLMQVMSKVHHDKFQPLGGVKAALNPVANIKVGATILKEYVRQTGSVESGLKLYVGAGAFETDAGYGYKVLAEYKRLKDVASGKSVPTTTTVAVKAPAKPAPQPAAEEKDDVLNQAQLPAARPRHEKDRDEDGVVAAL
jgi:soluble lytic murein transglycosylase-like protein